MPISFFFLNVENYYIVLFRSRSEEDTGSINAVVVALAAEAEHASRSPDRGPPSLGLALRPLQHAMRMPRPKSDNNMAPDHPGLSGRNFHKSDANFPQ